MDENHVEVTPPVRHVFTREQKTGYAVVIICGVLAVILGLFYMSKHLRGPFAIDYSGSHLLTGEEARVQEVARQKAADTDQDGISDYDELEVYGSSPYLADTDGDGMADNVEIVSNTDPACATGAACDDTSDDIRANTSVADGLLSQVEQTAADATAQADQIKQMLQNLSASDIRTLLVQSGADQAQIDAMTDAEVVELYDSVVVQLEASGDLDAIIAQIQEQGSSQ